MVTIWSWPIAMARRVCSTNAATSEPRKFSPSPRPMTSGELRRAPTTTPGSSSCMASRVNAPSSRATTRRKRLGAGRRSRGTRGRRAGRRPRCRSRCRRCSPSASSSSLSSAKFSMMPLWMRASLPSSPRCGCALRSVGPPCVAQRVWPMPVAPSLHGGALEVVGEHLRACRPACGCRMLPVCVDDGDAGGVVAAVLEALEAAEQHLDAVVVADVSHDSTHGLDFRRLSRHTTPGNG